MTDRELGQRVRAWYSSQVRDTESAPDELRASVAAIPATVPAPLRPLRRRRDLGLLALAAVLLLGGALAAGSGIVRFTRVPPGPFDAAELVTPAPAPSATPLPTANLRPGSLIAYARWAGRVSRLWVAAEGGRDAHELFPGGVGDQYGRLAWSPDGSQLLYSERRELFLADVDGGEPRRIDTGCVTPCDVDTDATVSSDGTNLAFVRHTLDEDGNVAAVIATLDLASGQVALLASTASDSSFWPSWSPDGQRIVFSRLGDDDVNAVFVVDRDGGNLHRVSPPTLAAGYPEWSPDGARIVFWSADFGKRPRVKDIYTIRPDGTDLLRLTTGGVSSAASWSADGRILFAKNMVDAGGIGAVSFWTMDADGGNASMLVPADAVGVGDDEFPPVRVVRQPLGGPAITAALRPAAPGIAVGPPPPTPTTPELGPGFTWTGSMDAAKSSPLGVTATPLADGRVLFVGSCDRRAQIYDPETGTFSPTGSLTLMRGTTTATLLHDGRVLLAGGDGCDDATTGSAELYDPTTGTFSPTGSMTAPRMQHTATLLADGRVLIAGGIGRSSTTDGGITLISYRTAAVDDFLATAEVYDPRTGTFSETDSMSTPHRGHTATLLRDGRVLVVGNGGESSLPGSAADLYDPATGRFSRTGSMKTGRSDHTATLLEDGRVLFLGGDTADDPASVSAELYDPATGTFAPAGKMADGRSHHAATTLSDGRVLVLGGYWNDGQDAGVLASAELFDPVTGRATLIGSMGDPRAGATATLLPDGRVLIAGGRDIGRDGAAAVASAVLYQP